MAAADGLPAGFRFHPTDEELLVHYLEPKVRGLRIDPDIMPVVDNLYKCEPWELPEKSFMPTAEQPEWYLLGPRDRKYPSGNRTKRATPKGHWKSTGNDRRVLHCGAVVGMKKTLVYHVGRAPQGVRTDWTMHEYRLGDDSMCAIEVSSYALCRLFNKKLILSASAPPPEVPVAADNDGEVPLVPAPLLEVPVSDDCPGDQLNSLDGGSWIAVADGDTGNGNVNTNFNIDDWLCTDDQLNTSNNVPSNDAASGAAAIADGDTGNVDDWSWINDQLITFDDDYSCMGYFPFSAGSAAVADCHTDKAGNVVDWPSWTDDQLNIFEDDYSWMADYFPSNDGAGCSGAAPDARLTN